MKLLKGLVLTMATTAIIFSMDDPIVGITSSDYSPNTLHSLFKKTVRTDVLVPHTSFAAVEDVGELKSVLPNLERSSQAIVEKVDPAMNFLVPKTLNVLEAIESLENILLAIQSQHSTVLSVLADLKAVPSK